MSRWTDDPPCDETYVQELPSTKTSTSIKPVVISQFVDLDSFAIAGRLHLQRHDLATGGKWRLVTPGQLRNECTGAQRGPKLRER